MATIKVKALRDHPYSGKQIKAGAEYEYDIGDLNPDHVSLPRDVELVKSDKKEYQTRDMKAEK